MGNPSRATTGTTRPVLPVRSAYPERSAACPAHRDIRKDCRGAEDRRTGLATEGCRRRTRRRTAGDKESCTCFEDRFPDGWRPFLRSVLTCPVVGGGCDYPFMTVIPVYRSWQRIETWLAEHAPRTFDSLRPPASADAISAAADELRMKFPADLVESLRCHDGVSPGARSLPVPWRGSAVGYCCHSAARSDGPATVEQGRRGSSG